MFTVPDAVLLAALGSAPFEASSATLAVSDREFTPAGSAALTVAAKIAEPDDPAPRAPAASVQTDPGLSSGAQAHPAVEAPASKTMLAGTVAVSVTPVAP